MMKNTFIYVEKEASTKIHVKIENLEDIKSLLKEMTQYIEANTQGDLEKEGLCTFTFEDKEAMGEAEFFEKIVKEYPAVRPHVLEYVQAIDIKKVKKISLKGLALAGIAGITALSLVDSKYYKDFVEFFERADITEEEEGDEHNRLAFTDNFERILATQPCDKSMMELIAGFAYLFDYGDIELPQNISTELFDYLLKIRLEQEYQFEVGKPHNVPDDIEDVFPSFVQQVFDKVNPSFTFFDCLYDTDIKERFKKDLEAQRLSTYDSLLGIKANPTFHSANDQGIEVIVDIEQEEDIEKAINLLCQLFREENVDNVDVAYNIDFGRLGEDNKFEITHHENSFFSYVIENYSNLHDTVLSYAYSLSTEVGDNVEGLPEGIGFITELAQTDKKYISEFGHFILSRDLNHASAGWQERDYVLEVLTEWDWCPEIIDLAVECFCTPAQWGPEEWIPIDKEIRPEVFDTFMKKLCDRKRYLHEKEAMIYDENFEVKIDYIYQNFYGIDDLLVHVFEGQNKEDLGEKFNKAIGQNCYPTYAFFKMGKMV